MKLTSQQIKNFYKLPAIFFAFNFISLYAQGKVEAPNPWGPWSRVASLPGAYIPSLIPKGTGSDYFFFTAAGGTESYNLNIGRIEMKVIGA